MIAPIVSQACIFRTKLFVFSIRRMLRARLSVTLIGNPSGTATTIKVTAIMKYFRTIRAISSHWCQSVTSVTVRYWYKSLLVNMIKVSAAIVNPALPIRFANLVSWIFSGVCSWLCSVDWRATLPISVASPTRSTRMIPCPSVMVVPRITEFEGYVASSSKWASSVVLFTINSPVSVDSLTCKETASTSIPSAGTSSPVFRMTISPTTISLRGISFIFPLRITVTGVSSPTAFSKSNFLLASYSK